MAKKSFAPPVTNFSVSCDPSVLDWLNLYAFEHKTTRSKLIRKAINDFRAANEDAYCRELQISAAKCIVCGTEVLSVPGVRGLCLESPSHIQEPPKKVENPIDA